MVNKGDKIDSAVDFQEKIKNPASCGKWNYEGMGDGLYCIVE